MYRGLRARVSCLERKKGPMCDNLDPPDHDYESIYGREAMHARRSAWLAAIFASMEAHLAALGVHVAALQESMTRMEALQRHERPEAG